VRKRPLVLFVGADDTVVAALRRRRHPDYDFSFLPDAQGLLETMVSLRPDALVLDADIPECAGFRTSRLLNGDFRLRHVPVVFLSSRDGEEYLDTVGVRASCYLKKPVPAGLIVDSLDRMLPHHKVLEH
jgi:chemosensory pili system protein ChpA (sensor histidine kinase/response regulator)